MSDVAGAMNLPPSAQPQGPPQQAPIRGLPPTWLRVLDGVLGGRSPVQAYYETRVQDSQIRQLQRTMADIQGSGQDAPSQFAPPRSGPPVNAPMMQPGFQSASLDPSFAAGAPTQPQMSPSGPPPSAPRRGGALQRDLAMSALFSGNLPQANSFAAQAGLPDDQAAIAAISPDKYGEAAASNFAAHTLSEGQTQLYGNGQAPYHAPKTVVDEKSGGIASVTPDGVTPLGQFGGDFTNVGGVISSGRTGEIAHTIGQPQKTGPGESLYGFTPGIDGGPGSVGGNGSEAAPASGGVMPDGTLDQSEFFKRFTIPQEGTKLVKDINGFDVRMGVNAKYNPGVDLTNLTPEAAQGIYANNYWNNTGVDKMPAPIGAMVADTSALMGPGPAQHILQESGGDLTKYAALRMEQLTNIAMQNPKAPLKQWAHRTTDLLNYAQGLQHATAPAAQPGQAQPQLVAAAQTQPGQPSGPQPLVRGATNVTLSPQEAMAQGLAPGVWQRDPTGTLKNVSPAPKGDIDRIDSLTATSSMLRDLVNEQTAWMQHNKGAPTGPGYLNHEIHGVDLNPLVTLGETWVPDVRAMSASEGKQVLMVKPANAGARILQSELPFWKPQTQSLAATGDVNESVLTNNIKKLQQAEQASDFYRQYVYQHGSLNGADQAYDQLVHGVGHGQQQPQAAQSQPAAQSSPVRRSGPPANAPRARLTVQQAAALPPGTVFVGLDGLQRVHH